MNPAYLHQLIHYMQNNPQEVTITGNIVDLHDGVSIYVGGRIVFLDAEQQIVPMTPEQQDLLRCVVDYCRMAQTLERAHG